MKKEVQLTNSLDQIPVLAEFVEQFCVELGLGMDWSFKLNLVLEEAVTNVILYAFPQDEVHTFTVSAEREGDLLTVVLRDNGVPFDPIKNAPQVDITQSAEERQIGGLGIFLIQELMDEVKYAREDGFNVLTMLKHV